MRRGATPSEIETLYRDRFDHFLRVATAIAGEAGHDVVQAAFVGALRHRRSFRGDGSLEAWVWRIVVNEARRSRTRRADPVEPAAATNGHADASDDIRGWIATLPERQREAIFLRYFADLPYRDIAAILEIEVGTVSATLGAAHRALRKKLMEVRR